jgi:hypothetical protein
MNESRYRELKEKMAALKSLYASRHYSQCAKFGELLLSEIHDQVGALSRTCLSSSSKGPLQQLNVHQSAE